MKDQSKKHMKGIVTRYILAILFALSWAVLGVALAIEGAKVSVAGNINFEASGVQAEVNGEITGTKDPITLDTLTFNYETPSTYSSSEEFTTWKNLDLTFADGNTSICITIIVENLNKERSFYIVPTVNISANNLQILKTVDGTLVSAFSPIECAPLATTTFKIFATVEDKYTAITAQSFKLNFELSETIKNESDLSGLAFTYSSDGTATVSGADSSLTKIVIPDKVVCKDSSGGDCRQSL